MALCSSEMGDCALRMPACSCVPMSTVGPVAGQLGSNLETLRPRKRRYGFAQARIDPPPCLEYAEGWVMSEIEAELDDAVERMYPYMFLSDTRYVGGLFAGLMTVGREPSPAHPSRDGELDPAGVLDERQEQLRRRLEQISPAAGRHFVGMCQAVAERGQRVTSVPDAFHNAREMVSALDQVLFAIVEVRLQQDSELQLPSVQQGQSESARAKLRILVDVLGMSAETAAAREALELHRYAHRQGLRHPRDMSSELIDLAASTARVAEALVDLYEGHVTTIHEEAARLVGASASASAMKRFARLVPPNHEVSGWLLDRLAVPEWWLHLNKSHFFDDVPAPDGLVHPRWPQSRYLARIASDVRSPADFARLLIQIGSRTRNVRVHEDLVRAATKLPAAAAAAVLRAESTWPLTGMHERVARLVGEPEIVRYPTWLAGLMAHVAFHPDSVADEAATALDALQSFLAMRVREDSGDDVVSLEAMQIDDRALVYVLLHLRAHCTVEAKIKIAQQLASDVLTLSDQIARATVALDVPLFSQTVPEVIRWYLDDPTRSDRSHLILPEWPEATGDDALSGLGELLSGLVGFLIDLHASGVDQSRTRTAPCRGPSRRVGLMDRVWLAALAYTDRSWSTLAKELLQDERLASSATTRSAYVAALQRQWELLDARMQKSVREVAMAAAEPGPAGTLVASAPFEPPQV